MGEDSKMGYSVTTPSLARRLLRGFLWSMLTLGSLWIILSAFALLLIIPK